LNKLNLEDFIQSEQTLLVEVGQSRIKAEGRPIPSSGLCSQCIRSRDLKYHCQCGHRHYCSKLCRSEDRVYHFKACPLAFSSTKDEEYKKKKISGVSALSQCGLKNLGNTCYMNSSIQAFLGVSPIVDYLTENKFLNCEPKIDWHSQIFLEKLSMTFKLMGE
jgi:uncharacterized UBP type Zn finger protein